MQSLLNILLVEDDPSIAGALAHTLKHVYEIDIASHGKLALYKTDITTYDLIVLDLNLPDLPGLDICQQLRERGVSSPILILTGESSVLTKINLLDAGADDYLTKPFSLGELKARLRALGRKRAGEAIWRASELQACGIILDRRNYTVFRDGQPVYLRRKEFDILECLMAQASHVVTREALVQSVWQDSDELWTNALDVHINHLREKIDRPFTSPLIQTVHGRGYKLDTQDQLIPAKVT
jgi:DNA-binding response OmpR family regulator